MNPDQNSEAGGGRRILAVNGGSSSLKFALFDAADITSRILAGKVERIGLTGASWSSKIAGGPDESRKVDAPDHAAAAALLIDWVADKVGRGSWAGVGHRLVHGGMNHYRPERVTPDLIEDLREISPLDPEHLPREITIIEAFEHHRPGLSQIACFDTDFHHEMPRIAQIVPIPRRFEAEGVRRYGFHGLSYAYLMEELAQLDGESSAKGRVILAHLGSGASLAAVLGGKSVDTTMGFTPTSGLVMGTRTGDLDPGVVRFLTVTKGMSSDGLDHLVNKESGLLGVSETSPDLRDLLAHQADDPRAAEAVALFCQGAKKAVGAYAAVLGGLDTLVFAGGIGENSPEARARICEGLGFLGVALDPARNMANAPIISADTGPVRVRVIPTDEERMVARATARLLS